MIKVSVIIPVYNVDKYLKKCILSVLDQSLEEYEVIAINDGSTDNSLNILNEFLLDNKDKLKVINKENGGVSNARNVGIDNARGEYLLFLDGDDWIEKTYCEEAYKMAKKLDLDMVLIDYYENNKDSELSVTMKNFHTIDNNEYINLLLRDEIYPAIWLKFIKKSVFSKNKIEFPKDIRIGEDFVVSIILGFFTKSIGKINKPLLHYVIRDNSAVRNRDRKSLDIFKAIDEIQYILLENNLMNKFEKEFTYCKFNHLGIANILKEKPYNDIHLEMYKRYKELKIDLNIIKDFEGSKKYIFHMKAYFINYNLGAWLYYYYLFKNKILGKIKRIIIE